jgi:hypothetical protein
MAWLLQPYVRSGRCHARPTRAVSIYRQKEKQMHTLNITLVTAALALGIYGSAYSADSDKSTRSPASEQGAKASGTQSDRPASAAGTQSPKDPSSEQSTRTDAKGSPSERPAAAAGTQTTDQQTYQARMKKCDAMNDSADKQNCADKAKKDHGQM